MKREWEGERRRGVKRRAQELGLVSDRSRGKKALPNPHPVTWAYFRQRDTDAALWPVSRQTHDCSYHSIPDYMYAPGTTDSPHAKGRQGARRQGRLRWRTRLSNHAYCYHHHHHHYYRPTTTSAGPTQKQRHRRRHAPLQKQG